MSGALFDVPVPGWYPDPVSESHVRWWDGRAWTDRREQRSSLPTSTAPPMPAPVPTERLRPRREALAKEGWVLDPTPGVHTVKPSWLGFSASAEYTASNRPTAWSTPGSWWLAFMPWVATAVVMADQVLQLFWPFSPLWLHVAALGMIVLIMLLAVISDRAQLVAWRHVRPASTIWILVGPFFYLLARAISVHRNVRRGGWVPLVVFVVNVAAAVVVDWAVTTYLVR